MEQLFGDLEGLVEFPQVLEEYITYTGSVGDGMEYNIYHRGVSYYEQFIWFNINPGFGETRQLTFVVMGPSFN